MPNPNVEFVRMLSRYRRRPVLTVAGDPFGDLGPLEEATGNVHSVVNSAWFEPYSDLAVSVLGIISRLDRNPPPGEALESLDRASEEMAILAAGLGQWASNLKWLRRELLGAMRTGRKGAR